MRGGCGREYWRSLAAFEKESIGTRRVPLGELSLPERKKTSPGVTRKRREQDLSAFRFFRLSSKELRQFFRTAECSRFARGIQGYERNPAGLSRTPRFRMRTLEISG